tara:strand:- start:557 stop:1216 length:660 start_codon:yes stop_codon:yes gene_type:complete
VAKRNLTVLFGADTSKLTKALGGLRKKINGAFKGMLSLKGMAVAGIGGFGISQAIGVMMNLSPAFANAMLKMREPLMNLAGAVADTIAPWFQSFAEWLSSNDLAADIYEWLADLSDGFDILADYLMSVPAMLKEKFNDIIEAFSDIYDALMILWRKFSEKAMDKAGEVVKAIVNDPTGRAVVEGAASPTAMGIFQSLMTGAVGMSIRGNELGSLGQDNR